jgi:hypothetical protein
MKSRPSKSETAEEFINRLQSDPEWVRENARREAEIKARIEQAEREMDPEEKPLLADLASVGIQVESVWDLVNAKWDYPAAIPILAAHLQQVRHPRVREGIARALTVPEARGAAARVILAELQKADNSSSETQWAIGRPSEVRWALANALTVAADKSMADTIEALIANDQYADVRERLKKALAKLSGRRERRM